MNYTNIKNALIAAINENQDKKDLIMQGACLWLEDNIMDLSLEQIEVIDSLTDKLQAA